jgi:hypothetical protein
MGTTGAAAAKIIALGEEATLMRFPFYLDLNNNENGELGHAPTWEEDALEVEEDPAAAAT